MQPKAVIVRANGPSLPLGGVLSDPVLEVHDATGAIIATNDNWQESANKQAIIDAGFAPTNDKESAILMTLKPGPYTAIVRGVDGTTCVALVEVYDLDRAVDSKLANISTRGFVQTSDNVMIGGIIILGDTDTDVLVRAIGPALAAFGVSGHWRIRPWSCTTKMERSLRPTTIGKRVNKQPSKRRVLLRAMIVSRPSS